MKKKNFLIIIIITFFLCAVVYVSFQIFNNAYAYNKQRSVDSTKIDKYYTELIENEYEISLSDALAIDKFVYTGGRDGNYIVCIKNITDFTDFVTNVLQQNADMTNSISDSVSIQLTGENQGITFYTVDNVKVNGAIINANQYQIGYDMRIYKENNCLTIELSKQSIADHNLANLIFH